MTTPSMNVEESSYKKLAASYAAQQTELAELRAELQQREDYIGHLSHQLRTPLMAVLGYGAMLTPSKQHNSLLEAAEAMLAMLSDMPQSNTHQSPLRYNPANLSLLAAELKGVFSYMAQDKGLEFAVEVDEGIPEFLLCDMPRIRHILSTLTHNAIRYTPRGRVVICMDVQVANEHEVSLRFVVEDTGIGMTQAQHNNAISTNQTGRKSFGRAGRSLARATDMLTQMQSVLHIESAKNEGTRMWFMLTLPIHRASNSIDKPASPQQPLRAMRVLVVDDNAMTRHLLEGMLQTLGIDAIGLAANGAESMNQAQQGYELILMDCQMPEMDGFEAARKLKHNPITAHIPIIGMTADVLRSDTAKCFAAGMDDYHTKPLSLGTLEHLLRKWQPPQTEQDA